VADLLVRAEGQRRLVDLQRRELRAHHLQQLHVDDELLEAGDEPALEPAGAVHHPVDAGEEGRHQGHQRLVPGLRIGHHPPGVLRHAARLNREGPFNETVGGRQ